MYFSDQQLLHLLTGSDGAREIFHERSPMRGADERTGQGLLHITSNTRISIDPPSSSNARLSVDYTELIEAKDLPKPTSHSNAALSSTYYEDWDVSVAVCIIAIFFSDSVSVYLYRYLLAQAYVRHALEALDSQSWTSRPVWNSL